MGIEQKTKRALTPTEREFRGVTIALELSADSIGRQLKNLRKGIDEYDQTTDHIFDRLLEAKTRFHPRSRQGP